MEVALRKFVQLYELQQKHLREIREEAVFYRAKTQQLKKCTHALQGPYKDDMRGCPRESFSKTPSIVQKTICSTSSNIPVVFEGSQLSPQERCPTKQREQQLCHTHNSSLTRSADQAELNSLFGSASSEPYAKASCTSKRKRTEPAKTEQNKKEHAIVDKRQVKRQRESTPPGFWNFEEKHVEELCMHAWPRLPTSITEAMIQNVYYSPPNPLALDSANDTFCGLSYCVNTDTNKTNTIGTLSEEIAESIYRSAKKSESQMAVQNLSISFMRAAIVKHFYDNLFAAIPSSDSEECRSPLNCREKLVGDSGETLWCRQFCGENMLDEKEFDISVDFFLRFKTIIHRDRIWRHTLMALEPWRKSELTPSATGFENSHDGKKLESGKRKNLMSREDLKLHQADFNKNALSILHSQLTCLIESARKGLFSARTQNVLFVVTLLIGSLVPVCEKAGVTLVHIVSKVVEAAMKPDVEESFFFNALVPILHIIAAVDNWPPSFRISRNDGSSDFLMEIIEKLKELTKISPFREEAESEVRPVCFSERRVVTITPDPELWGRGTQLALSLNHVRQCSICFKGDLEGITVFFIDGEKKTSRMLDFNDGVKTSNLGPGTVVFKRLPIGTISSGASSTSGANGKREEGTVVSTRSPCNELSVTIDSEIEMRIETSKIREAKNALSVAIISCSSAVFSIRGEAALLDNRNKPENFQLFAGGLKEEAEEELKLPGHCVNSAGLRILEISLNTFSKALPCLKGDAVVKRAALAIVAHNILGDADTGCSGSEMLHDKRISEAANRLRLTTLTTSSMECFNSDISPNDIASFVCKRICSMRNCRLAPVFTTSALADAAVRLVSQNNDKDVLEIILHNIAEQVKREISAIEALSTLLEISNVCDLGDLFTIFRGYLSEYKHYMEPLMGCGKRLEILLRSSVTHLIKRLLRAATAVRRQDIAHSERLAVHRYVNSEAESGNVVLEVLALLACPLDAADLRLLQKNCQVNCNDSLMFQLNRLAPQFSEFSRSSSFNVSNLTGHSTKEVMEGLVNTFAPVTIGNPNNNCGTQLTDDGQFEVSFTSYGVAFSSLPLAVDGQLLSYCEISVHSFTPEYPMYITAGNSTRRNEVDPRGFDSSGTNRGEELETPYVMRLESGGQLAVMCTDEDGMQTTPFTAVPALIKGDVIGILLIKKMDGALVEFYMNGITIGRCSLSISYDLSRLYLSISGRQCTLFVRFHSAEGDELSSWKYNILHRHPYAGQRPTPYYLALVAQSVFYLIMRNCSFCCSRTSKTFLFFSHEQQANAASEYEFLRSMLREGAQIIGTIFDQIASDLDGLRQIKSLESDITQHLKIEASRDVYDKMLYMLLCVARIVLGNDCLEGDEKVRKMIFIMLKALERDLPYLSRSALLYVLYIGFSTGAVELKNGFIGKMPLETLVERLNSFISGTERTFLFSEKNSSNLKFLEHGTKAVSIPATNFCGERSDAPIEILKLTDEGMNSSAQGGKSLSERNRFGTVSFSVKLDWEISSWHQQLFATQSKIIVGFATKRILNSSMTLSSNTNIFSHEPDIFAITDFYSDTPLPQPYYVAMYDSRYTDSVRQGTGENAEVLHAFSVLRETIQNIGQLSARVHVFSNGQQGGTGVQGTRRLRDHPCFQKLEFDLYKQNHLSGEAVVFGTGDIITVKFNPLDGGSVSFWRNRQFLGTLFKNIYAFSVSEGEELIPFIGFTAAPGLSLSASLTSARDFSMSSLRSVMLCRQLILRDPDCAVRLLGKGFDDLILQALGGDGDLSHVTHYYNQHCSRRPRDAGPLDGGSADSRVSVIDNIAVVARGKLVGYRDLEGSALVRYERVSSSVLPSEALAHAVEPIHRCSDTSLHFSCSSPIEGTPLTVSIVQELLRGISLVFSKSRGDLINIHEPFQLLRRLRILSDSISTVVPCEEGEFNDDGHSDSGFLDPCDSGDVSLWSNSIIAEFCDATPHSELLEHFNMLAVLSSVRSSRSTSTPFIHMFSVLEYEELLERVWAAATLFSKIELITDIKLRENPTELKSTGNCLSESSGSGGTTSSSHKSSSISDFQHFSHTLSYSCKSANVYNVKFEDIICAKCGKNCWNFDAGSESSSAEISKRCTHPLAKTVCEMLYQGLTDDAYEGMHEDIESKMKPDNTPLRFAHRVDISRTPSKWENGYFKLVLEPCELETTGYFSPTVVPVHGHGSDTHGEFTVSGVLVQGCIARLRFAYAFRVSKPSGPASTEDLTEWDCPACTFKNSREAIRCAMCYSVQHNRGWECSSCDYVNPFSVTVCDMCGTYRPGGQYDSNSEEFFDEGGEADENIFESVCSNCEYKNSYSDFATFNAKKKCNSCGTESIHYPNREFFAKAVAIVNTIGNCMHMWRLIEHTESSFTLNVTDFNLEMCSNEVLQLRSAEQISSFLYPLPSPRLSHLIPRQSTKQNCVMTSDYSICVSNFATKLLVSLACELLERGVISSQMLMCALSSAHGCTPQRMQLLARGIAAIKAKDLSSSLGISISSMGGALFENASMLQGMKLEKAYLSNVVFSRFSPCYVFFARALASISSSPVQNAILYYLAVTCMLNGGYNRRTNHIIEVIARIIDDMLARGDRLNVERLEKIALLDLKTAGFERLLCILSLVTGRTLTTRTTTSALTIVLRAVQCLKEQKPLPLLLAKTESCQKLQYVIPLPDTRLDECGRLLSGKLRNSVGIDTNKRGKYYFEVVYPDSGGSNRSIYMGWGTRSHEMQTGARHVGNDVHSVSFNLTSRAYLMTQQHEYRPATATRTGDVIGALLDLDICQMCWSVNGRKIQWLPFPLQSPDPIYMFVSADFLSTGVEVRFQNTEYLPEGFTDLTSELSSPHLLQLNTNAPPQSYLFYKQLLLWMNECASGVDTFVADAQDLTSIFEGSGNDSINTAFLALNEYTELWTVVKSTLDCRAGPTDARKALNVLHPYMVHLQNLSSLALVASSVSDLTEGLPHLSALLSESRELQLFSARWAMIERQMRVLMQRDSARIPLFVLDTDEARLMRQGPLRSSITAQLFDRCARIHDFNYRRRNLFTVEMKDSIAHDEGGITRTAITMMCEELNGIPDPMTGQRTEPRVPLFTLNTHSTMKNIVPNMALLETEQRPRALDMFVWLGNLFGNAALSGTLLYSMSLPRLVWKKLVGAEVDIDDVYYDIDDTIRGSLEDRDFMLSDDFFTIMNIQAFYKGPHAGITSGVGNAQYVGLASNNRNSSVSPHTFETSITPTFLPHVSSGPTSLVAQSQQGLFPRSASKAFENAVDTAERRQERIFNQRRRAAIQALLSQYDTAITAIKFGLEHVIPFSILQQMRWDDLERSVCGSSVLSGETLLHCMDTSTLTKDLATMFHELILHRMTAPMRERLLLFCTGQTRLPIPGKIQVSCGDNPALVPTAHTCTPISLILQPYRTVDQMMEKFLLALPHAYGFGFI